MERPLVWISLLEVRSYEKARELVTLGKVSWNPFYPQEFNIASSNEEAIYKIILQKDLCSSKCNCKDYVFTGRPCKHIGAAALFVRRQFKIEAQQETLQLAKIRAESRSSESEELLPANDSTFNAERPRHASLAVQRGLAARNNPSSAWCWEMLRMKKHIIDTAEKHEKSEQEKASASSSGNSERKEADVANRRNRSSKEKDSKPSAIARQS